MTPDDFCRHFKTMRENYYLKISYSIYECFVYQFDRILVMLNYKEDEINVLEEKAWFDKYLKQFNVNKTNWKNSSSYKIYDLIGLWWQKFEKNAEFVINRQRGPEPCKKNLMKSGVVIVKTITVNNLKRVLVLLRKVNIRLVLLLKKVKLLKYLIKNEQH